jgi:hypothetical protein
LDHPPATVSVEVDQVMFSLRMLELSKARMPIKDKMLTDAGIYKSGQIKLYGSIACPSIPGRKTTRSYYTLPAMWHRY